MATTTTRRRPSQLGGTGRWAATAALRWAPVTLLTVIYYIAWALLAAAAVTIGFALFSETSSLQASGRWVSVALLVPSAIFNFIVFPHLVRKLRSRDSFSGSISAGISGGGGDRS